MKEAIIPGGTFDVLAGHANEWLAVETRRVSILVEWDDFVSNTSLYHGIDI